MKGRLRKVAFQRLENTRKTGETGRRKMKMVMMVMGMPMTAASSYLCLLTADTARTGMVLSQHLPNVHTSLVRYLYYPHLKDEATKAQSS